MQAFVIGGTVVDVALVVDFQGFGEEGKGTGLRLRQIALPQLLADLQELYRDRVLAHQKASQVVAHAADKMLRLKAFADNVIQDEQDVARVALQDVVDDLEIIVVVEHVQVVDDIFIGDVLPRETHHLVEDGERVAQGAIGFLGDDVQGLRLSVDAFALGDIGQVFCNIVYCNTLEIKDLATGKNGRDDFVLLRGGQDELGVRGRLFQGLQESVESRCRKHVNLVDDVDFILSDLRGNPHLVDQTADVFYRVIGCSVQLVDVERSIVVEGTARLAFVAGLHVLGRVEAVDGLGHDACAGGLAYASRTAKQKGLRQGVVADGVFQGVGDGALAYDGVEGHRPVFSC